MNLFPNVINIYNFLTRLDKGNHFTLKITMESNKNASRDSDHNAPANRLQKRVFEFITIP